MFNDGSSYWRCPYIAPKQILAVWRAVRTNFCPLKIGLYQCSVARSLCLSGVCTVAIVTLFQHFPETAQQLYFQIPNDPQR